MIDFTIQLKNKDPQAWALIVAYHKDFKSHRFTYSTGLKVASKGFRSDKLSQDLKHLLEISEDAYQTLIDEGTPVSNETLSKRIKLLRKKLDWHDNEIHIYIPSNLKNNSGKVLKFPLTAGVDKLQLEKQINTELLKQKPELEKVILRTLSLGKTELFGFWQSIIDGKTKPRAGEKLRTSTLSVKRQTMKLVKDFNPTASFENMDMQFYNEFTDFLNGKLDPNTITTHVRQLKSVLNLAFRNELMNNDRFRYWPVTAQSNEVVTLTKEELLAINNLVLSGTKKDIRDIFIIACFLGCRISDFKSFKPENLTIESGILFFSYVQEKTGSICKIPVHPIARAIIDSRGGNFPNMISEQNFRYTLKEITEAAGLTNRVVVKIRNGKPQYKKKFEAITPHSARRTFASNLFYGWFLKPMPASLCMRYTGHKTEKSFMLYVGASEEQLNEMALKYFDFAPQMAVSK